MPVNSPDQDSNNAIWPVMFSILSTDHALTGYYRALFSSEFAKSIFYEVLKKSWMRFKNLSNAAGLGLLNCENV